MKITKFFKMSTALSVLGSLFLSGFSYGMSTCFELKEEEGHPIVVVTRIKTDQPTGETSMQGMLERFSKMSTSDLEKLTQEKQIYDISPAPEGFERAFEHLFVSITSCFTLRSGKEVHLVPLRGGKDEFLEWTCGLSCQEKRFDPYEFLQAMHDRARFMKEGLATFPQIIESCHALEEGRVVVRQADMDHIVSLASFKGFSDDNPLEGLKSENDHLSGLTWWIIEGGARIGFVQAVNLSVYEGESHLKIPFQPRAKFGVFPGKDFSEGDRDDIARFFQKKMNALKGTSFSFPNITETQGKMELLTASLTFKKIASVERENLEIAPTTKEHDITPLSYASQMGLFNRIFGRLEGMHQLTSGEKIRLTPLVGGRQFEEFGPFFGRDPNEAAENFTNALKMRDDFFTKELILIVELPSIGSERESTIMPISKFSILNRPWEGYGKITSQRTQWGNLRWLVYTEGNDPLGTIKVNETSCIRSLPGLGKLYDPSYSLSFSFRGGLGSILKMDYDAVQAEILRIFEDKWWKGFKPIITEMPIL
ncbi:MAG: hypothetical protein JSS34_05425 [Proteobacteria bacterium]|nr:hypothetical protein [Pseudomonadota bacterium]